MKKKAVKKSKPRIPIAKPSKRHKTKKDYDCNHVKDFIKKAEKYRETHDAQHFTVEEVLSVCNVFEKFEEVYEANPSASAAFKVCKAFVFELIQAKRAENVLL